MTRPSRLFRAERQEVQAALDSELGGQASMGAWTLLCHPVRHLPTHWEETDKFKAVLEKSVVRIRREFPPITYGTHVRVWGICNRHYEDTFGLTRSGLSLSTRLWSPRPWCYAARL